MDTDQSAQRLNNILPGYMESILHSYNKKTQTSLSIYMNTNQSEQHMDTNQSAQLHGHRPVVSSTMRALGEFYRYLYLHSKSVKQGIILTGAGRALALLNSPLFVHLHGHKPLCYQSMRPKDTNKSAQHHGHKPVYAATYLSSI